MTSEVSERMKEILARRDEIRRKSEERVRQGLSPFPTVEEIEARKLEEQVAEQRLLDALDELQ